MAGSTKNIKPTQIEELKKWPHDLITENQFERWQAVILTLITKDTNWAPLITQVWANKSVANRNLNDKEGRTATQKCSDVNECFEYISHYGPVHIQRDIQCTATSLANVWKRIRAWAEIQTTGNSHLTYYHVKRSFDHGSFSYTDFYYKLLHTKEDCLLLVAGNVTFKGARCVTDEELKPLPPSDVVLDWMHAIGGPTFVEHVFHVFAKILATETLHDIWQRILNNVNTLIMEAKNTSKVHQLKVGRAKINSQPAYSEPKSID